MNGPATKHLPALAQFRALRGRSHSMVLGHELAWICALPCRRCCTVRFGRCPIAAHTKAVQLCGCCPVWACRTIAECICACDEAGIPEWVSHACGRVWMWLPVHVYVAVDVCGCVSVWVGPLVHLETAMTMPLGMKNVCCLITGTWTDKLSWLTWCHGPRCPL